MFDKAAKSRAWQDSDDEDLDVGFVPKSLKRPNDPGSIPASVYTKRSRQYLDALAPSTPDWVRLAKVRKDKEEGDGCSSDDELLNKFLLTSRPLTISKGVNIPLPEGHLKIFGCKDANHKSYSSCVIQTIDFQRQGRLMLTGGFDKTLRLFDVDGRFNKIVASVHLTKFPIRDAKFSNSGQSIFCLGQRTSVVEYDIATKAVSTTKYLGNLQDKRYHCLSFGPNDTNIQTSSMFAVGGDNGRAVICDAGTKRMIRSVKMNGKTSAIAFDQRRPLLHTADTNGWVYSWDVATGRCVTKFCDEGSTRITDMAVSENLLAVGNMAGYVTLFDISDRVASGPPPVVKTFGNLKTPIESISFNPTGEVMAFAASGDLEGQLRLLHVPSRTVFANFPCSLDKIGEAHRTAFSYDRGHLAVGSASGRVALFQMKHYEKSKFS